MSDEPTYLVCAPYDGGPFIIADNVVCSCGRCGRQLQRRPDGAISITGFVPLCYVCASADVAAADARGEEVRLGVTRETMQELAAFLAQKPDAGAN